MVFGERAFVAQVPSQLLQRVSEVVRDVSARQILPRFRQLRPADVMHNLAPRTRPMS
jgi:hypothetical protein